MATHTSILIWRMHRVLFRDKIRMLVRERVRELVTDSVSSSGRDFFKISPVVTAEFSKFADILSAALSQCHLSGFEITQLEFHHLH